jgi:predicted alpha/beta hydrolase family esterase
MKNALILHGTDANSSANWFPWLKKELEKLDYQVWVPTLPYAHKPNIQRYAEFLLANRDFEFTEETIIIGHSSGAVAILGLLEALPENTVVNKCYLVGSFMNDLGWDSLKELFVEPFDFEKRAQTFTFIHSDNDPYCPLAHAKYLATQLNGKLIIKPGEGHFSGENITIPEIVDAL